MSDWCPILYQANIVLGLSESIHLIVFIHHSSFFSRRNIWRRGLSCMWLGPHTILWNAVTSPETVLNDNSVKTTIYNTLSPIHHCISQLGENTGGKGYWVSQNTYWYRRPRAADCQCRTSSLFVHHPDRAGALGWWLPPLPFMLHEFGVRFPVSAVWKKQKCSFPIHSLNSVLWGASVTEM